MVKELANQVDDVIECLNIPVHAIFMPITRDYIKYNSVDNQGEVHPAMGEVAFPKLWNKF